MSSPDFMPHQQKALALKTCESIEKQIAFASALTATIAGEEADHERP